MYLYNPSQPSLPLSSSWWQNFAVTISIFTECKRRIGSGRIDAQCRLVHIPCLAGCRYSGLSVFSSLPVIYIPLVTIYLPSATHVPVGEDQTQHLELSRDIADIFNRTFDPKKRFFPLPLQLNSAFLRRKKIRFILPKRSSY